MAKINTANAKLLQGWGAAQRARDCLVVVLVSLLLFVSLALISYHRADQAWTTVSTIMVLHNWGGKCGALLADLLLLSCGVPAFMAPLVIYQLLRYVWRRRTALLNARDQDTEDGRCSAIPVWMRVLRLLVWLTLLSSICALLTLCWHDLGRLPAGLGGILGQVLAQVLLNNVNLVGASIVLLASIALSIIVLTRLSLPSFQLSGLSLTAWWGNYGRRRQQQDKVSLAKMRQAGYTDHVDYHFGEAIEVVDAALNLKKPPLPASDPVPVAVSSPLIVEKPEPCGTRSEARLGEQADRPQLSLLATYEHNSTGPCLPIPYKEFATLIEQRLLEFGVIATVTAYYPGPVITRFELAPAPGVKVGKITSLAKDLARSLSVASVRVVEVIPGKPVIGLEVANKDRETVGLRCILESELYTNMASAVSLALGKDIAGHPVIVDLAKMPHLLVAGTTGSGKSVSINVMLLSMLYKSPPEKLKLILVDPKMLELSIYGGIPHLLTPVITDMNDVHNALKWCVGEMDKRYKLMSYLGVRNLAGYNAKIIANADKQPLQVPEWLLQHSSADSNGLLQEMPLIVVVIDELADLVMVLGKKIEELIVRLAQKARAAGIHLILATQRPSVDVITGLIKANVPTRIAFQVSSRIDSRTILDQQGAEQLLGYGDMLYLPAGAGIPVRVHGAYVSDEEVHAVVEAWRNIAEPVYVEEIVADKADDEGGGLSVEINVEQDPLYDQAVFIVTESRRASASLIQRRLRIGYNRAARIMEAMEAAGLVTAMDATGNRKVLANSASSL